MPQPADTPVTPEVAELLRRLADAFARDDRENGRGLCDAILERAPAQPGALHMRGVFALRDDDAKAACEWLERAVEARPDYAMALWELGQARIALDRFGPAVEALEASVRHDPVNLAARASLSSALRAVGRLDAAEPVLREGLRQAPEDVGLNVELAFVLLGLGRWGEGWRRYEYRRQLAAYPTRPLPSVAPQWRGEALEGRTIVLQAEQGFGDAVQFVRYAQVLADRGARVLVRAKRALEPIMVWSDGVSGVARVPLPPHDYQSPMMSVPCWLDPDPARIPAQVPYIHPPADRVAACRQRLERLPRPWIGLAWTTAQVGDERYAGFNRDKRRKSLSTDHLRALTATGGGTFVSLQVGLPDEARAAERALGIVDPSRSLTDFGVAAALVANLDAVVSIDTAAAHLAGALGQPVWLMLRRAADWRWLSERADTPWYPRTRLLRQAVEGDWDPVVACAARALAEFAARRREPGVP